MGDNPFEDPEEERTVIIPRPGGSRRAAVPPVARPASPPPAAMAPAAPPPPPMEAGPPIESPGIAPSPILGAAATLIDLAVRLRSTAPHGTVDELRERVIGEMRRFEERLGVLGIPAGVARAAHYAVCATIDDVVLNTPWGSVSIWAHHSLASSFHNEAVGGERFFLLLDNARRNPAGNLALLELMYVCLSIGFAGRFRLRPQGASELIQLKDELYRAIRNQRPARERDLSPAWQGLGLAHQPLHSMIPVWVSVAAGAFLVLLVYIGFVLRLNTYSDQGFDLLARLPPTAPVMARTVAAPVMALHTSRLHSFLDPEIREGLVTVRETTDQIDVSIVAQGMFDSGSAEMSPRLISILQRIGQALREEPGDVLVAGHTDNIPIRSMRFPSNWHLSQERAKVAKQMLVTASGGLRRIDAQGFADTRPLADNGTAEGRAQNRRIEVIVKKPLPDQSPASGNGDGP